MMFDLFLLLWRYIFISQGIIEATGYEKHILPNYYQSFTIKLGISKHFRSTSEEDKKNLSRGWNYAQQLRAPFALVQDPALVPRTNMAAPDYLQLRIPWHQAHRGCIYADAFCILWIPGTQVVHG